MFLLIYEDVLTQILNWNLIAWKFKWKDLAGDRKKDDWMEWLELAHILDLTIKKIGERAFAERQYSFSWGFLKNFQKHVDANENEQILIGSNRRYYLEALFKTFYQLLFEKVAGSAQSYDFWENFPRKWRITKNTFEDRTNLASKISLNEFLEWAVHRIVNERDFDTQLNDVSNNLFPEAEPSAWAAILIFVLAPYSSENRVRSTLELNWNFGYSLKPVHLMFGAKTTKEEALKAAAEREENQRVVETQNAYELALLLFSQTFTKELLEKYMKEAGEIKYDEKVNPREYHRKMKLTEIFKGLMMIRKKNR